MASKGSNPNSLLRNLLIKSPSPSHTNISTIVYEAKLATDRLALYARTFASG